MTKDRAERRLTTILAADVVGYSRLIGTDEAGTLEHLTALVRHVPAAGIECSLGWMLRLLCAKTAKGV